MTDESNGYTVGYRKPPAGSRFKPGKSGNPKGRPKGAKNFATALEKELNSQIVVTDNGKRRKVTKREAIAAHLVHKAVKGEDRATATVLSQASLNEEKAMASAPLPGFGPQDTPVLDGIIRRIRSAEPMAESFDESAEGVPSKPISLPDTEGGVD